MMKFLWITSTLLNNVLGNAKRQDVGFGAMERKFLFLKRLGVSGKVEGEGGEGEGRANCGHKSVNLSTLLHMWGQEFLLHTTPSTHPSPPLLPPIFAPYI